MGLFDAVTGFFDGSTAQTAANQQVAGLNAGYGQASDLLGQGRGALTTNFTNALQPLQTNFNTANAGQNAYANATGVNGPAGNATALANFQAGPGYQYQLQQGTENELRNQSRTGAVNSGQTQADLQTIGQGQANQGWQQYIQNLQPFLGGAATAASGIAGVDTGLGTGLNASLGNQAQLAQTTQTGIGNANANATLAQNSGVANLLGLGMNGLRLGASALPGVGSMMPSFGTAGISDERLKENKSRVGKLFDGQDVWAYNYIGDDVPHIGLMAQEVERHYPDAVIDVGGVKAVRYDRATKFSSALAGFL